MNVNFDELKACGFNRQRQPNYSSLRLKFIGGHVTAQQLGFEYVTLNLQGYRVGSMNLGLKGAQSS